MLRVLFGELVVLIVIHLLTGNFRRASVKFTLALAVATQDDDFDRQDITHICIIRIWDLFRIATQLLIRRSDGQLAGDGNELRYTKQDKQKGSVRMLMDVKSKQINDAMPSSKQGVALRNRPKGEVEAATDLPTVVLSHLLSRAGWNIDYAEIDLTKERPALTVRCHRADGLWIWARADEFGRCTMDRFRRKSWLGRPANVRGRQPQSPQIEDMFLGRVRATGPRSLLRQMCDYLATNALSPIPVEDMRDAWRSVMQEPIKLICAEGGARRE